MYSSLSFSTCGVTGLEHITSCVQIVAMIHWESIAKTYQIVCSSMIVYEHVGGYLNLLCLCGVKKNFRFKQCSMTYILIMISDFCVWSVCRIFFIQMGTWHFKLQNNIMHRGKGGKEKIMLPPASWNSRWALYRLCVDVLVCFCNWQAVERGLREASGHT